VREGSVDDFEDADDKDQMIYNLEGFGMGKRYSISAAVELRKAEFGSKP
jgi:hypothetical protein